MTQGIHPEVVELQSRIFAGQLNLSQVLNRADVRRSTWWRWTQGAEPKFSTLAKVRQAIDAKLSEREAA